MFTRIIKEQIIAKFFQGKLIIVTGARQVGKTTLVENLLNSAEFRNHIIKFNGDNPADREKLNNRDIEYLNSLIGDRRIIFIDEAQKIETIGQTLKLLIDTYRDSKQVIATGSSSINLLDQAAEPLTGRKIVFHLYPLSLEEMYPAKNLLDIEKDLDQLLIFGGYPAAVSAKNQNDKIEVLRELSSSYLYKDILEFQDVRNSSILHSLIKALALQLGSEVSYNELSSLLGISKITAERYVDLLEKNYIIFRLPPYSKNLRRAISKLRKIYFYDLGIRNAVINNFNPLADRADSGALWENFAIIERLKYNDYRRCYPESYFMRTYDGTEIDLIEESAEVITGYEFKLKTGKTSSFKNKVGIAYKEISPEKLKGFIA